MNEKRLKLTRNLNGHSHGVLFLPLAILLVALSFAGMGIWGLLRKWRFHMETQLRLDRCVGMTAQNLKGKLNALRQGNGIIHSLRASIEASVLVPATIPALKAVLMAAGAKQDFTLSRWKAHQLNWLTQKGCDSAKDVPVPLPAIPLVRPPADAIGIQSLQWNGASLSEFQFRIQLGHSPRHAAAVVYADALLTLSTPIQSQPGTIPSIGGSYDFLSFDQALWKTEWAAPKQFFFPLGPLGPSGPDLR